MNTYQTNLYRDMKALVELGNDAFYSKRHTIDGHIFEVYNYRLASYTDFMMPSALQARGIMFELDPITLNPIKLACMMPHKFFNDSENPLVMDLVYSNDTVDKIMIKEDGSIISTYMLGNTLALKSKTSVSSEHCKFAMEWLSKPEQEELQFVLAGLTVCGFSVHMELVTPMPDLKIVVNYPVTSLVIHSIRDTTNGEYMELSDFAVSDPAGILSKYWVKYIDYDDASIFIDGISAHVDLEGYIVQLKTGQKVKIKTDWYKRLHNLRDDVSSPRKLFECVLAETIDDIIALFPTDVYLHDRVNKLQLHIRTYYNNIETLVEQFYIDNKRLDRKSYAIKGQQELAHCFSLGMMLFLGKPVDYKQFMLKNYDMYKLDQSESTIHTEQEE